MPGKLDLLVLEGMSFYGYHGETEAERTLGNRFYADVEVRMDLSLAGRSDHIADTLDYAHAFALVREVVEQQRYRLIEAVAERVAATLLGEPRVVSVKVRVGKQPPIPGAIDRCWVNTTHAISSARSSAVSDSFRSPRSRRRRSSAGGNTDPVSRSRRAAAEVTATRPAVSVGPTCDIG